MLAPSWLGCVAMDGPRRVAAGLQCRIAAPSPHSPTGATEMVRLSPLHDHGRDRARGGDCRAGIEQGLAIAMPGSSRGWRLPCRDRAGAGDCHAGIEQGLAIATPGSSRGWRLPHRDRAGVRAGRARDRGQSGRPTGTTLPSPARSIASARWRRRSDRTPRCSSIQPTTQPSEEISIFFDLHAGSIDGDDRLSARVKDQHLSLLGCQAASRHCRRHLIAPYHAVERLQRAP